MGRPRSADSVPTLKGLYQEERYEVIMQERRSRDREIGARGFKREREQITTSAFCTEALCLAP